MVRRFASSSVRLLPLLVCVLLTAGCGGSGDLDLTLAPTPAPPGPLVGGTVFAPRGRLSRNESSPLKYLARLVSNEALALVANETPVGRSETVTLSWYQISGAVNENVTQVVTNDQGQYRLVLPPTTTGDTSRFVVSAGTGANLTRAFVTGQQPVDITFVTETVVRLILPLGTGLANVSSSEIREIERAVRRLPGTIPGITAAAVNDDAYAIASADPAIIAMVDAAAGLVAEDATGEE